MQFLLYLSITLFLIICVVLILLVLIQKGRGGGLSSAFGGGGGNTAFGSKTGDVLTWATSVVFGIFLLLAIGLNLVANAYNTRVTGVATNPPTAAKTAGTPISGQDVPPPEPGAQDPGTNRETPPAQK